MSEPIPSTLLPSLTPQQRLRLSRYALQQALQPHRAPAPDPELAALLAAQRAYEAEMQAQQQARQQAVSAADDGAGDYASPPHSGRGMVQQAHDRKPGQTDTLSARRAGNAEQTGQAGPNRQPGSQAASGQVGQTDQGASRTTAMVARTSSSPAPHRAPSGARLWAETGYAVARSLLSAWWSRHPLNLTLQASTPALSAYGRRHPYRVLGVAAALGVAVVVLRPWRWARARHWAQTTARRQVGSIIPRYWWQDTMRAMLSRTPGRPQD